MNLTTFIDLKFEGTSEGAKKAWDKRGRGRGRNEEEETSKPSEGLVYKPGEKKWLTYSGKDLPSHLEGYRIPPAWTDVQFNPDPGAALLVTGKDAKGRLQPIYSREFTKQNADAKFKRVAELDEKFTKIKAEVENDVRDGIEEAFVLRLIMGTGIRPGSTSDTGADKQAYGATTLEGRHIFQGVKGDVRLRFVGKKGVKLNIPVDDKAVAANLIERKKSVAPNKPIFSTTAGKLSDYSSSKDGGGFKTKDFRTRLANELAMSKIEKMKAPKSEKDYKKAVRDVGKFVAEKLGNTHTVALASYIRPSVFAGWKGGKS